MLKGTQPGDKANKQQQEWRWTSKRCLLPSYPMVHLSRVSVTPIEVHGHTVSAMLIIAPGYIISRVTMTPTGACGHSVSAMPIVAHG